jgi:hypothetical protein
MYRLDRDLSAWSLEAWAMDHQVECHFVDVMCQHGIGPDEQCDSCEGGYADDHHSFIDPPDPVLVAAETDDILQACYIPINETVVARLIALKMLPDESEYTDIEENEWLERIRCQIEEWIRARRLE